MRPELDEYGALLNALLETQIEMRDEFARLTAEMREHFALAGVKMERLIAHVNKVYRASPES